MTDVLHKFSHGLGDAVQFTAVLQHLKHYLPEQRNHVLVGKGKHSLFWGLADGVNRDDCFAFQHFDRVIDYAWHEPQGCFADSPSTKAARCLHEVWQISPQQDLMRYRVRVGDDARARVAAYASSLPTPAYACIHYQGNTSTERKDLPHDVVKALCEELLARGVTPVILDWDRRSPLPDGRRVFCPAADHPLWIGYGTGDGETLAAMMERSALNVVIDSGPGKVAAAVSSPCLAVWTGHHPLHFSDLADNVTHLVPYNHERLLRGRNVRAGLDYFQAHYAHFLYDPSDLAGVLCRAAADDPERRPPRANPMPDTRPLRATSFDVDYYEEHKAAGLDYLGHGAWQEEYGRWLVDSLGLRGKDVLDVGCAAGSIALGLHKAGGRVVGIDLNNHTVRLGRERFGLPLYVCDAVNLHLFGDQSFDFVHANQVAEHWKEHFVPLIFAEVRRVLKPGGMFLCVHDTSDLFERQGRDPAAEDPTNGCIRPLAWWREQAAAAGLPDARGAYEERLRAHGLSYLRRYDWDWMLCRR